MRGSSKELMFIVLMPYHHWESLLRMLEVFLHLLNLLLLILNCSSCIRLCGRSGISFVKVGGFRSWSVDHTSLCCSGSTSIWPWNRKRAVGLVCFLCLEDQIISRLELSEGFLRLLDIALQGTSLLHYLRGMLSLRRWSYIPSWRWISFSSDSIRSICIWYRAIIRLLMLWFYLSVMGHFFVYIPLYLNIGCPFCGYHISMTVSMSIH